MEIKPIATVRNDLPEKFGVPKQSGLAMNFKSEIVFEEEFSSPEAIRGLDGFSHIWVIWGFSENDGRWSPTVRPPRLGGNKRMGVFATRSPFRPNGLGLSSLELERADFVGGRCVLTVRGADMKDGTPVFDIKPYLPEFDSHKGASSGFAKEETPRLSVRDENNLADVFEQDKREELFELLSLEVRPQYHADGKIYKMAFCGKTVEFRISDGAVQIIGIGELN